MIEDLAVFYFALSKLVQGLLNHSGSLLRSHKGHHAKQLEGRVHYVAKLVQEWVCVPGAYLTKKAMLLVGSLLARRVSMLVHKKLSVCMAFRGGGIAIIGMT